MSPTPRAAAALAAIAAGALLLPAAVVWACAVVWAAGVGWDAWRARLAPSGERRVAPILSRGVPTELAVDMRPARPETRVRVRQASTPDLGVERPEGEGSLRASIVGRRRGRHVLPALATRTRGRWGLASWGHRVGPESELLVYPDLRAARRLVLSVREGRFREAGRLARGPLGLGTDFDSIRDYLPDDDFRQINWPASARMGRAMSNQYRIEQDRDVVCLVDAGRLMNAPVAAREGAPALTRLDAAIDAATAVALVADELEDRCGVLAFDDRVLRHLPPRRRGGAAAVRALFDLEPSWRDSAYELAFRLAATGKRALVLVLTDLLDEAAARGLIEAVPPLARRHAVIVASTSDPDLEALAATAPDTLPAAHAMAVAIDVLDARARVAGRLRRAGAHVLEAPAASLSAACVRSYVDAKRRARL